MMNPQVQYNYWVMWDGGDCCVMMAKGGNIDKCSEMGCWMGDDYCVDGNNNECSKWDVGWWRLLRDR